MKALNALLGLCLVLAGVCTALLFYQDKKAPRYVQIYNEAQ